MLRHHSEQLSIPWGEMSIKEKDFILGGESKSSKSKRTGFRLWYNLNSFIYDQRGRTYFKGSNDSVFGDSCQKGGEMSPKQKDRTTTNFKNLVFSKKYLSIGILLCSKGEQVAFQNNISKPSWTLRGGSPLGGVLLSQRKSIWNRRENFKSRKCFAKSYSFIFDYLQKNFEKDLQKNL